MQTKMDYGRSSTTGTLICDAFNHFFGVSYLRMNALHEAIFIQLRKRLLDAACISIFN